MGIDIEYQPIDESMVKSVLLPFVLGEIDKDALCRGIGGENHPIDSLIALRNAYQSFLAGEEFVDGDWGECDPGEYLGANCVRLVLDFCQRIYPSWHVPGIDSISLLPDDFPILEHYQMPIALFEPIAKEVPDVACSLRTIADCPDMGGFVQASSVLAVRQAIQAEHANAVRDPDFPDYYDAAVILLEALSYAEEHGLSFTEAIS